MFGEFRESLTAILDAHAGLLVPTEGDVDAMDVDLVDPHGTSFDLISDVDCLFTVRPPIQMRRDQNRYRLYLRSRHRDHSSAQSAG